MRLVYLKSSSQHGPGSVGVTGQLASRDSCWHQLAVESESASFLKQNDKLLWSPIEAHT